MVRKTEDGVVLAKVSFVPVLVLALAGFVVIAVLAVFNEMMPEDPGYPKIDPKDAVVGVFVFSGISSRSCYPSTGVGTSVRERPPSRSPEDLARGRSPGVTCGVSRSTDLQAR
jgi:hypothetical protein